MIPEGSDVYDIAGYRAFVEVEPDAQAAARAVLRGFGPVTSDDSTLPRYELRRSGTEWHIRRDDAILQVDVTLDRAVNLLEWHLIAGALQHRRDLFHLHAASLASPDNRGAVALVGRSGGGKTTMTLALSERGFKPFGDDVTLLDPATLEAHPLRRAFHVSEQTRTLITELTGRVLPRDADAPPECLSPAAWASHPVPVRWLLFIESTPGARPELHPLSPSDAAADLLAESSTLTHASRLALSTCARLTAHAGCYRFVAGDLAASVVLVQQLVGSSERDPVSVSA